MGDTEQSPEQREGMSQTAIWSRARRSEGTEAAVSTKALRGVTSRNNRRQGRVGQVLAGKGEGTQEPHQNAE